MSPLLTDDELPKPRYYVVNGYLYTSRGAAENCARMISPTEGESLPVDALYTAEQMRAMHAQGVREGRAAAFREAADVCAVVAAEAKQMDGLDGDYESGVEAGAEQCCDALRARAEGRT